MIRIKLHELLGKRRMKITDLEAKTGIHRNTLYRLYHETGTRIDLDVLERLCTYFECPLSDLMEFDPEYERRP